MEISVLIENGCNSELDGEWLRSIAGIVLEIEKAPDIAEMGLVITGQEQIQALNREYLDEDRPTDVLSFALSQPGEQKTPGAFITAPDGILHLGEVIISYPQAVIQAEEHRHPIKKEIALLLVHGILHLLGYDHDTPQKETAMRGREADILDKIEADGWLR